MKKFFAIAALAASSLVANAQAPLYATGDFAESNWNPAEPVEFVYADGAYTLELPAVAVIKISTAMGDWDAFNGGALTCTYPDDKMGQPVELAPGDGNILMPWGGHYVITVAGDLSTITLTTDTPQPPTVIYLRGNMNDWNAVDEWQFTTEDGDLYKFTCSGEQLIAEGVTFKIADANWAKVNYGVEQAGDILPLDVEMPLVYNAKDISLTEDWNGVCWFQLSTGAVFFSNDKEAAFPYETSAVEAVEAAGNEAPVYFNLQGVRVANPQNGLFIVVKGNKARKVLVK